MGARMYDPELGRFISPDSIIEKHMTRFSRSKKRFEGNDPCSYLDHQIQTERNQFY